MNVGDRIKKKRLELGLSQSELAERMGYSHKSAVSKAELRGDSITTNSLHKYAKALGVTEYYLLGWEEGPDQRPEDRVKAYFQKVAQLSLDKREDIYNYIDFIISKEGGEKHDD